MTDEKKELRPLPIAQIKNNAIRRLLMVLLFVPIVVISWVVHTVMAIWWYVQGIFMAPIELIKNGAKYWSRPRDN